MNRLRKRNKGLPRRVYIKHGAYYYVPIEPIPDPKDGKPKKWIPLGRVDDGESPMLAALARLLGDKAMDSSTMPYLCAEYRAKKLGKYGEETRATYAQYLSVIAEDFEDFRIEDVTTRHWSEFLANHYAEKKNTAKKITALARKAFRYAISELGARSDNPLDQIDLDGYETKRREVLPTHEQVKAIRAAGAIGADGRVTRSGPMFACLVDITYLCWQRAVDIRTLKETQVADGFIRFKPSKTSKSSGGAVNIAITPAIADVIERARAIKRKHGIVSGYVFCATAGKAAGKPYTKSGLFSMWDRARERAKIADGIQFKDLRALGATDALKAGADKKDIQNRLVHTTGSTTEIYLKEVVPTVSNMDSKLPWGV